MSLPAIIESLQFDADFEHNVDYLAAAAVINSVNQPKDIQHVYSVISTRIAQSDDSPEKKTELLSNVVLRLREAILKSFVIIGFPKTINTLQELARVTSEDVKKLLPKEPLRKDASWDDVQNERERGRKLFSKIYDRHTDKVISNMHNGYPDLAQTALHHLYGHVISETSVLSAKETSLVLVAALMAQNVPLQLVGHVHGAIHNGATDNEINRVKSIVTGLADYYKCPIAKL
ncbi:AhpD-like protein [Choanephora cucurbitarum]|nr:AhpD-like protein [Choanephora cucurbitarum]